VNLRSVTQDEFEIVYDVLHENALWLLRKDIIQWPLDWLETKQQEIQEHVELGMYYAVEIDNEIAAIVEIRTSPEDIWENDKILALYIHKLAIRRKFSNENLGRKVINLIESKAVLNGVKFLRLDCVAHNDKLRQYYEANGFSLKTEVYSGEICLALYECKVES
jgi:ribosomal protein S18 acetylase RimI-like enzyme